MLSEEEDVLGPIVKIAAPEFLEAGRLGYRNGCHPRKLTTRVGTLDLRVPLDRAGRFQRGTPG